MLYPCPHCKQSFNREYELFSHALSLHSSDALIGIIRVEMKKLTRNDFIQVNNQWVYALGSFHLSLSSNPRGEFTLHIYASIDPIPPADQYPTEPEWEKALELANKFVDAYAVALEQERAEDG